MTDKTTLIIDGKLIEVELPKMEILKEPPKHIMYNGCLYEKIDSDVVVVNDEIYGKGDK